MKSDGTPFKGRKCCTKSGVDPAFMAAYTDPHNLFPAGGEVNGDRSAYPFGRVESVNAGEIMCRRGGVKLSHGHGGSLSP